MKGKEFNPIDEFVARHMRNFIIDHPVNGIPQEIKDLLKKQLREVATHKKAERLATDIIEDFHRLLKNHPELYQPKKLAKRVKNIEVFYTTEKTPCPNIISADLNDGATLIENRYGYFDVYCIKEQLLKNQTREKIRYALIKTGRATRFLKPGESIIIAPTRGNIGTLIEQELDGDNIVLTYQLIILPHLEKTKSEETKIEDSLTAARAYAELEK